LNADIDDREMEEARKTDGNEAQSEGLANGNIGRSSASRKSKKNYQNFMKTKKILSLNFRLYVKLS
jgi:hypothetical protein